MTHRTFGRIVIEGALSRAIDGERPEGIKTLDGCQVDRYEYGDNLGYYVHIDGNNSDLLMSLFELADKGDLTDSWALQQGHHNPEQAWFSYGDITGQTALIVFTIFPELVEVLGTHKGNRIKFGPGIKLAPPENHVELNPQGRKILADDLDNHFIPS